MMNSTFARLPVFLAVFSLLCASGGAQAANLVSNGNFALTPVNPAVFPNRYIYNTDPASIPYNWKYDGGNSTGGIAVVFSPGMADQFGAQSVNGTGYLWGPNNPSPICCTANGLPAQDTHAPAGSNYIASDSDPSFSRTISQTVGAVHNEVYQLTFDWGAAQFREPNGASYNGATTSRWTVRLGNQNLITTAYASIPEHGFYGWKQESVTFTYNGATDPLAALTFLADGTPSGAPPVALLGNVALNSVPEPASLAIIGIGLLGSVALRKFRSAKSKTA